MNPAGKFESVRTFPSTLMSRCITILLTSGFVNAYFKRLRKKITNGRDSLNLCGPWDGRGANVPPNLSNIHAFGACKRFKCFLGPRAYNHKYKRLEKFFWRREKFLNILKASKICRMVVVYTISCMKECQNLHVHRGHKFWLFSWKLSKSTILLYVLTLFWFFNDKIHAFLILFVYFLLENLKIFWNLTHHVSKQRTERKSWHHVQSLEYILKRSIGCGCDLCFVFVVSSSSGIARTIRYVFHLFIYKKYLYDDLPTIFSASVGE